MLEWIAYGEDWSFTSDDGGPGDVPAFGVLVVSQPDPDVGRVLMWHPEKTFFVHAAEHGEWDVKDYAGLIDFLAHFPGCVVRFGRGVPNPRFRAVMERAANDPRLPVKSGWRQGEEKPRGL